ncbi:MAG TPA: hypothetical protein VMT11_01920 [Myxococcaceae bacterium]|nr:hypothetical protein [Myxococcaceae bacterium]
MRPSGRLAIFVLVLTVPALAQDAGSAGGASKPARPKPNPALTEAFKDLSGTWACTGTMDNPQSPGSQVQTKSEMKIAPEVDGFAYSGSYRMEKNAAVPAGMKGILKWGWDEVRGKLVEFGFDNMGSSWLGTSEGQKGDTVVWAEEGAMMGQPAKTRTTVTRKGPREMTVVSEVENKGAWQKMGEDHCKKK